MMPSESTHHTSGSLPLAVALASTAGFVDAFVFLNVTPVFTANMSGNLIRLGISAGETSGHTALASIAAIGSFLVGVAAAAAIVDRRVRIQEVVASHNLLLIESLLLAAVPIIMRVNNVEYSTELHPVGYVIIMVGSAAMGMQAVALRRVGSVAVSTTYGTGAIVRLGEKIALAARRTPRPDGQRRRVTIAVLTSVLVSYVAGAAFASAIGQSAWLLLLPAAVTFVSALRLR
jgi:uncharacterized membrane protein YoaK (UPF0700 family)